MKKTIIVLTIIIVLLIVIYTILYILNYIPHKKYSNSDFNIPTYTSSLDMDNDGIDDSTDILNNAKAYVAKKPIYKSKYYKDGYPDDGYGVGTDVVAFSLLDAGCDLKELVNSDIKNNRERYNIETIDKNIDFRRVVNLKVYFDYNAISLTTDINKIEEWQGGDIVTFKKHIGIISDNRNKLGIPFIIHHANPYQLNYEEDILEYNEITGHYRIS